MERRGGLRLPLLDCRVAAPLAMTKRSEQMAVDIKLGNIARANYVVMGLALRVRQLDHIWFRCDIRKIIQPCAPSLS